MKTNISTFTDAELEELENKIAKKAGDDYCFEAEEQEDEDGNVIQTVIIEVSELAKPRIEKIIKDSGYEILECTWFSGSSYDGYSFTVKKGK